MRPGANRVTCRSLPLAELGQLLGLLVGPGEWYWLDDERSVSRPFSSKRRPYIVIDASGPAVTASPRTTRRPLSARQRKGMLPHGVHDHPEPEHGCRLDRPGFITRFRCSFDREAFEHRYSCTEYDDRVLKWIFGR